MNADPDQPSVCELGSTGQLVRRALSPVPCPQRFRDDLRQRLVGNPPTPRLDAPPQPGFSNRAC